MPAEPKYITVNGVLKKNPNYKAEAKSNAAAVPVAKPVTNSDAPLAVVSSMEDVIEGSEIQSNAIGMPIQLAESTDATVGMLQDSEILARYNANQPLDGGAILDELGEVFTQYETPLGMINKLMGLASRKLDFIFDDSGSMTSKTDVSAAEAVPPLRDAITHKLGREPRQDEMMSRWQEAENRFHIMIDVLAYIPAEHIQVRFLNSPDVLVLDRTGKTPSEFRDYAHALIRDKFANIRFGTTPVYAPLKQGFDQEGQWSHYLFNDGVPNEGAAEIAELIRTRGLSNPSKQAIAQKSADHPLTLISCTNHDSDTEWMKEVDGVASWVAEVDDFSDESDEVKLKQGSAFPFTRGFWILCQLVASTNPYDLDSLDENLPFTKSTLDNILGRKLTPIEYQEYFSKNPSADLYVNEYHRFLTQACFSQEIIPKNEQNRREYAAGYRDGKRPSHRAMPNVLASISSITQSEMTKMMTTSQSAAEETNLKAPSNTAPNQSFMPPPPSYEASKGDKSASSVFSFGFGKKS